MAKRRKVANPLALAVLAWLVMEGIKITEKLEPW